jgi:hypothetical protein
MITTGPIVVFFKGHREDNAMEIMQDEDGSITEFGSYAVAYEALRGSLMEDYGEPTQLPSSLSY